MHTMYINSVSSVDQICYRVDEVHSVIDGDSVFLAMIDPHATGNYQFDGWLVVSCVRESFVFCGRDGLGAGEDIGGGGGVHVCVLRFLSGSSTCWKHFTTLGECVKLGLKKLGPTVGDTIGPSANTVEA